MAGALPVIDGDACLLDRVPLAECDACARACPTGALQLIAEGLALAAARCTGCGGCGAACPAQAIAVDGAVPLPPVEPDAAGALLLVCPERAPGDGRAICVQALGLQALAGLWLAGVRRLFLDTCACGICPSGRGMDLPDRLDRLNRLLADRGLAGLEALRAPALVTERLPRLGKGPDRRRRGFLGISAAVQAMQCETAEDRALARLQALGADAPQRRFAQVPWIDPLRCTACHACVRLCPEAALTLVMEAGEEAAYHVQPARCTGCGLCVAGCEEGAVQIASLAEAGADIPLAVQQCRGCRVRFHRPAARGKDEEDLCPVCARAPHFRKLHQVML